MEIRTINERYDMYIEQNEKENESNYLQGNPLDMNFPPKIQSQNEPFTDQSLISNEDYIMLITKLNEFADNTFTFGESILKKMEESGFNDKIKLTAAKSAEIGTNIFKKTKESINQINYNSKYNQIKEKATDKIFQIGGKFWSYFGQKNQSKEGSSKKEQEQ